MKILAGALLAILPLGAANAAAALRLDGWYGGVAAGMGTVHVTTGDWNDGTLANPRLNNEDLALKAIAGYHFSPKLAVEIAYLHFGDSKFSGVEPGAVPTIWKTGPVYGEARVKGVSLAGRLAYPFFQQRFSLFAKGGIFMWTSLMTSRPTIAGGTLALGDEQYIHDDAISWIYGAGAEMRVATKWRVRLEWEQTTVRFAKTFDHYADLPSLGVTLDF